jgi:hypothetical protein
MFNFLRTWVVIILLGVLSAGQSSTNAEKHVSSPPAKGSQPGKSIGADESDTFAKSSDFEKNLSQNVIDNTVNPDDHVRCFFTLKQLMDLQPIPGVAKLTEADESRVLTGLVTAVRDASEKDLSRSKKERFIARLTEGPDKLEDMLVGKTPGEALATIMDALYKITNASKYEIASKDEIVSAAVMSAEANGGADFAKYVRKKLYDPSKSWYRAGDAVATSDQLAALIEQVPDELAAEKSRAASQTASDLRNQRTTVIGSADSRDKVEQAAMEIAKLNGGNAFSLEVQERLKSANSNWYKPRDPKGTLSGAAGIVEKIPQEKDASKDYSAVVSKITSDASSDGQTDLSSVVDKARSDLNRLARPDDIGCAYQILSWNDARLWFGRSVANDFVAVQITVRNMNKEEEFILHNAMLSVRTDINGALGQYYEGVDKLGVEAHNNAGESLTARGIVGGSISAATTLLSALQPIVNVGNFSNAVAAFNGGVPKGWAALEPDHQKDQLLMIANSGFSASDGFKTVIPKSSTATFFTWFPAKPFLEGWWIQKCARDVAGVNLNRSSTSPQVGVDAEWARDLCKNTPASTWETIPYKNWSSISDQLFRDLSLAVIAGMHVREDSKNKASITDLKCPEDAQGRLDLSKGSSNGTLSCDVSGENLDKATKLRLENAGNLVDPARPEGVISEVSSDNTGAKVTFNTADLNAAPGDSYNVFSVGKDGTENATGQKVYLKHDAPKLTKVDPSTLDLGGNFLDKLSLAGMNLDTRRGGLAC